MRSGSRRRRSSPRSCTRTRPGSSTCAPSSPNSGYACAMPPEGPTGELRAAVVQDAGTGRVLMLAWMDDEALRRTRETGEAHFYSRSRRALWHKGETSGNTLAVEQLRDDCDGDAILLRVRPNGPACHTGSVSCFAPALWRTIAERARDRPEGSYVAALLGNGVRACAQKVGEEAGEGALAALAEDDERVPGELADPPFHSYLLRSEQHTSELPSR